MVSIWLIKYSFRLLLSFEGGNIAAPFFLLLCFVLFSFQKDAVLQLQIMHALNITFLIWDDFDYFGLSLASHLICIFIHCASNMSGIYIFCSLFVLVATEL